MKPTHPLVRTLAQALLGLCLLPLSVQAYEPPAERGLVQVDPGALDEVWLTPGADLSGYRQLLIDPVTVEFKQDWLREMRRTTGNPIRHLRKSEVAKLQQRTRTDFDLKFAEGLQKTGYTLVQAPGPGVLHLTPAIVDLYLNDPFPEGLGRSEAYVTRAGQATLQLQAFDAESGKMVGSALDHRQTRDLNWLRRSSTVFTQADLKELFDQWSRLVSSDLVQLHSQPAVSQAD